MNATTLLVEARRLLEGTVETQAGLLLRAATFLARQALESRTDELLARRVRNVEEARYDARLLLLGEVLTDRELAKQTRFVWAALSSACHLHAYELPPPVSEVESWLDAVQRFLDGSSV